MPRVKYHESARREALSRQQSAGASAQRAHAAEHGTMWHYTTGVLTQTSLGDWALVFAGILLLLYIVGTWNYDYFRKQGIPSTSPKVPFVGDMIVMFMNKSFPEIVKQQYKRAQDHGVYGSFQFVYPVFTVVDPELIKVVAVKEFDNFMNHQTVQTEKSDPVFSKNLFNLKDQAWRDMRATLSPAFTTSKIKGMFPLISKCGEQMVRHLRQKYADSKEGALKEPLPTDMKDLFTRLANDVIATAAFGVSCDSMKDPDNDFYRWGKVMTTFSQWRKFVFLGYILIPKLMQALRLRVLDGEATDFFFSLVNGTLKERRQKGIFRPDMLQLLMQAREGQLKADKEDAAEAEDVGARKKNMTDDDICAQAGIFFLAGFETVSTALCLTAHLLAHHDDVQKRLYAEISQVMEEVEGNASYESVQGMKYLDAVINESLRLYPPAVATERVCQRDTQLPAGAKSRPVTVRKGQAVSIPITGLHYDAEYWPDPEKFDPERFSDENKHNIKPFTYMPFGVGPRFCIGQRFALMEVKLALVHLLSNFELTPCPKTKHPLEFTASFNLMAKGGFWCGLTPRDL